MKLLKEKLEGIERLINFLETYSVKPEEINEFLKSRNTSPIKQKVKLVEIAKRPQVELKNLADIIHPLKSIFTESGRRADEIFESAEISIKYAGYIHREKLMADKIKRLEKIKLSEKFDYEKLKSISTEARQKLGKIRPKTIGQASRISGVSPSDVSVLLIYMGR